MASSLVLVCAAAGALGLGDMKTDVQLGQVLTGQIDIIGEGSNFDIDLVQVRRVKDDEAQGYGYELVGPYFPLTFNVQENKGDAFIEVRSQQPLNEPFLEFLVELYWPTGNVIRQYLVLPQEPPASTASPKPEYRWQNQPIKTPTPTPAASAPSRSTQYVSSNDGPVINPGDITYTVQPGDLLSLIARNWGRTTGQSSKQLTLNATRWLIDNNSAAFPNGNPDDLQVGVMLTLPPNVQLSPLDGEANGTGQVFQAVGTPQASQPTGQVILHTQPVSLTEPYSDIETLRAQVDVAEEEITRLGRENASYRRRLLLLESGTLTSTLEEIERLQQLKIERLRQQQELDAKSRALPTTRRPEDAVAEEPEQASVEPPEQSSLIKQAESEQGGDQNNGVLQSLLSKLEGLNWGFVAGIGAVSGLVALLLFRRRRHDDDGETARSLEHTPQNSENKPSGAASQPTSVLLPTVSVEQTEIEPEQLQELEADLNETEFAEEPEFNQEPEFDEEPPAEEIEVSLPGEGDLAVAEIEETGTAEKDDDAGSNTENDWMDRKFGSAEESEESAAASIEMDGELDPYSEDKLNLMPWADEDEMPQFELDEELLENLADDMTVEELDLEAANESDTSVEALMTDDIDVEIDLSGSLLETDSHNDDVIDDCVEHSDQGLISEIEMYLQLGKQEKATRLLAQLLDDVSIDQNDPRIQSLIERCRPKQA
ncbi:hypothetical protein GCM10025791_00040 [Halioxenophilus aromaticivorans]|uniref:LysM domain-containing protein n=2 Tax=Halioxenophilus aromaticivorans TaxID=1306992 RepID=A0AAV3TVK1_9ALTE